MLANAITNHIKTLNIVPTGVALRTGRIEATTVRAVMVMFPLGGYNDQLDQTGFYSGNQQIIVRSADPEEVYEIAFALQQALTVLGKSVPIDGYVLSLLKPRGLPIVYPINDAALYEGSVNFEVRATLT